MSDENTAELTNALQGDAAAIQRLADRIYDNNVEAEVRVSQELEAAAHAVAEAKREAAFHDAARRFQNDFPDIVQDVDAYKAAQQLDRVLCAERPDLTPHQRLRAVGEHIRKEHRTVLDVDGDHRSAVCEMMKRRHGTELTDEQASPDEYESEHAEDIAAIKAARQAHPIPTD